MDRMAVWVLLIVETVIAGGLMLLVPKFTRRGLLFGVYVGDEHWQSDEARGITRAWYLVMTSALVVSIVLGVVMTIAKPDAPIAAIGPLFLMLFASLGTYLWAHFRARGLAIAGAPISAAALVSDPPGLLTIPLIALSIAMVAGALSVADAWMHYAAVPGRIPMHFGIGGLPDRWEPKTFWSVMLLPLMTMGMGALLGTMACLTARAKRALRQGDRGVSFAAQIRFRRAVSVFLSGTVVLVAVLLSSLSYGSLRVALGEAERLPAVAMVGGILLVIYAVGGSLVLMFRYGQGGSRLEKAAEQAPLTNGLADNAHWVLGAFYVNRDDPSLMVEKRFGIGYTLNFGNRKVVVAFAVLVVVILARVVFALMGR